MSADLLGKFLALLCALIWAGAVILFKMAGERIQPLALNLYKTLLVFLLLLPLIFFGGIPFFPPEATASQLLVVFFSGLLGIAIADTLFFACLNRIGAALTAIVDCLYLPFVMLFSWIFLKEQPTLLQISGALLVILAIAITGWSKDNQRPATNLFSGITMGVLAMATMAISIIMMQPVLKNHSVFWVTEIRLAGALSLLIPLGLLIRNRRQFFAPLFQRRSGFYALAGTISGNLISMLLWVAAFKFTSVNSAAILNQTNTIFVVIAATVLLKEKFTRRYLLATTLALCGVILVLNG